ncbi:MAG: MbcA/ParS/Xre antitoxin family protein [Gemmobacter sp.]
MEGPMQIAAQIPEPAKVTAVALKAYARVVDAWALAQKEAAGLADMSESTWKRARKPGFAGELTKDQLLRLSAVIGIYKALELYFSAPLSQAWMTRPNTGPLFGGARPIDVAIEGGLPQILAVRTYLDALRGGA